MSNVFTFFGGFKIVNFLSLMGIIGYVIKNYIAPSLHDERKREQKQKLLIKEEHTRLLKERESVERDRAAERQQGKWLLAKIAEWGIKILEVNKAKEEQINQSQEQMKTYLIDQADNLSLDHAKKEIVPESLKKAEEELKKIFRDPKEQEAFLAKTIRSMKEDRS